MWIINSYLIYIIELVYIKNLNLWLLLFTHVSSMSKYVSTLINKSSKGTGKQSICIRAVHVSANTWSSIVASIYKAWVIIRPRMRRF